MIYSLEEIAIYAKKNSKYYSELYKNVNTFSDISQLPIVELDEFWSMPAIKHILTGELKNGVVFKSGGTSGNPKYSYFTIDEWNKFTKIFGEGFSKNGFQDGDRIGNLFYAGNLYASFMFIMKSLEQSSLSLTHFPMTGAMKFSECSHVIKDQSINVLAGVPTTFLNFAAYVKERGIKLAVEKIFFGGEALYDDQAKVIMSAFPGVKLFSIGYASVDGGHLGYFDANLCKNFEHRPFLDSSILEIVDQDSGEVITAPGVTGMLVYTNLTRKLMPIIRYPVGDVGCYTGNGDIFKISGRSDSGARIGPVTITRDDIASVLKIAGLDQKVLSFQLIIDHLNGVDQLSISLLFVEKSTAYDLENLKDILFQERKMLKDALDSKVIAPVIIKSIISSELIINERTGKQRLVIDRRI